MPSHSQNNVLDAEAAQLNSAPDRETMEENSLAFDATTGTQGLGDEQARTAAVEEGNNLEGGAGNVTDLKGTDDEKISRPA